jgi:hypothetical protein
LRLPCRLRLPRHGADRNHEIRRFSVDKCLRGVLLYVIDAP